jgi:hypothetical protein
MHTTQDNIRNIRFRIPSEPKALDWTRKQKQISNRVKDVHSLLLWHSNCKIHIKVRLSFTTTINIDHLSRDPHSSKPWLRPLSYTVFSSQYWTYRNIIFILCVSHHFAELCQPDLRSGKHFDDGVEFWDGLLLRLFSVSNIKTASSRSAVTLFLTKVSTHVSVEKPSSENRVILGHYAASSGNSLPMFRDKLSVPS